MYKFKSNQISPQKNASIDLIKVYTKNLSPDLGVMSGY